MAHMEASEVSRKTRSSGHAWPLFRTTFSADGVSVEPSAQLPFLRRGLRLVVRWDELTRIERTRRGIRFIFKDERRPVVVATLWKHERLVRVVQNHCPVKFDPTLRRSTWSTV